MMDVSEHPYKLVITNELRCKLINKIIQDAVSVVPNF